MDVFRRYLRGDGSHRRIAARYPSNDTVQITRGLTRPAGKPRDARRPEEMVANVLVNAFMYLSRSERYRGASLFFDLRSSSWSNNTGRYLVRSKNPPPLSLSLLFIHQRGQTRSDQSPIARIFVPRSIYIAYFAPGRSRSLRRDSSTSLARSIGAGLPYDTVKSADRFVPARS